MKKAVLLGLWVVAHGVSAQSSIEPVFRSLQSGVVAEALNLAQQDVDKNPESFAKLHVLGMVQIVSGDLAAAAQTFEKEIEVGKGKKTTLSGLEDAILPGSRVFHKLQLIKACLVLSAGEAAATNNRGVVRYLVGQQAEASSDFDRAAVLDGTLGAPWLNGALCAIDRQDFALAEKNARLAKTLGEDNARSATILAESLFRNNRTDRAKDELARAFEFDAQFPYALLVKSEIDGSLARGRDSERAFVQALASGPEVTADSRLKPRTSNGDFFFGSAQEAHLNLLELAYRFGKDAYRLDIDAHRALVENRTGADQVSFAGKFVASSSIGTFLADLNVYNGGKPGADVTRAGIPPSPDARFRSSQAHFMALRGVQTGPRSTLWLHANYRTADVKFKPNAPTDYATAIRDTQWLGEFRWDVASKRSLTQIGAAYATIERSGSGPRPFEPTEQILPTGQSKVWTGYVLHRRELTSRLGLTAGVLVGGAAGESQIQPQLDFRIKAAGGRTIHARITPRFNDTVSNLIPLDVVADVPQENPIDRREFSTGSANRDPAVQGTKSRQLDFELAFEEGPRLDRKLEAVLFNRRLNNINIQDADIRTSTALAVTPIDSGSATGLELKASYFLNNSTTFRTLVRYQRTVADFGNPTFDLKNYPGQTPVDGSGLPDFPPFQAEASVDYLKGPWDGRLIGVFAGARPVSVTTVSSGQPATYLSDAPSQVTAHLFIVYKATKSTEFIFRLYNLGSASFYPGYPGHPTALIGYRYRF